MRGLRIDRLLLTTDTTYVPTGEGPAESPQIGPGVAPPAMQLARTIVYTYDNLYRLTDADYSTHSTGSGQAGEAYDYEYDAVGNRLKQIIDGDTTDYLYDAANRLEKLNNQAVYTFDDNGNLLNSDTLTNTFDAANRLTSSVRDNGVIVEPIYNGVNDRVGQVTNGVTTTFALDVAGLPEVIYTSDGNAYLHLPGVIVTESSTGETRYLLSDGLGSIRHATDENAQVVAYNEFDPYGNPVQDSSDVYGYTGEWWEDDVELLHLRARWYAPETGTFLSRDPWERNYLQPQTMNGWSYVEGNPINFIDLTGLYRFAQATHLYHQLIEDGWMLRAITFRHVEFPIPGAGVGGRSLRMDMLTNAGAIFELEPIYNLAAGRREIADKLGAIQLASRHLRYPDPSIIPWNTISWHLGTQLEFGSIVRVQVNPFYDLVADSVEAGLVAYWAEPRQPPTVPIPALDEVNQRIRKPRYWTPPLNLQPAPQPAYSISLQESCRYTLIGIGVIIIGGTLVEDYLTGGLGVLDDPASMAAGTAVIEYGQSLIPIAP